MKVRLLKLIISEFEIPKITVVDKEFSTTYENVNYIKNYISSNEKLLLITSGYNSKRLKSF